MTELVGGSHDVGKRLATVKAQVTVGCTPCLGETYPSVALLAMLPPECQLGSHKRALERFRTLMK